MSKPKISNNGQRIYESAQQAFEWLYGDIILSGEKTEQGTLGLYDIGFYITRPKQNKILTPWRAWNEHYAEREWEWYLSHSRDVSELQKHAPTWKKMHNGDNQVNSNYGWQWSRNQQLKKVIKQLEQNWNTRQAWITLFDGKEKDDYFFDTPCTLNIGFDIREVDCRLFLDMTVLMRSNDLIYGFCNDQYCFSKLQQQVVSNLNLDLAFRPEAFELFENGKVVEVGEYYHYAHNMHIYLPKEKVYSKSINDKIAQDICDLRRR